MYFLESQARRMSDVGLRVSLSSRLIEHMCWLREGSLGIEVTG